MLVFGLPIRFLDLAKVESFCRACPPGQPHAVRQQKMQLLGFVPCPSGSAWSRCLLADAERGIDVREGLLQEQHGREREVQTREHIQKEDAVLLNGGIVCLLATICGSTQCN